MTSTLGGSRVSPKSENCILVRYFLLLSLSKAAHPPFLDCIPDIHSTPLRMELFRRVSSASGSLTLSMAMTTRDASSMSGYRRLSNSNDHPPGRVLLARTCQSPPVNICLSMSQRAEDCTIGSSGARPESSKANWAIPVSQTGEMQACTLHLSSSSNVNTSKPSKPFFTASCSGP